MSGVQTEYFLGVYFLVTALSWNGGRVGADGVRLVAGVVLLVLAVMGISLVR